MEVLAALGNILLEAIPTFILVWILYFYTTRVFFRPLQQTLRERDESTGGLRRAAEANIALAEQKTAEYQEALRSARTELYRQQEQERQRALEQREGTLRQARQQAEETVRQAQQEIGDEVEEAKNRLAKESEEISLAIAQAILRTAPAPSQPGSLGESEAAR